MFVTAQVVLIRSQVWEALIHIEHLPQCQVSTEYLINVAITITTTNTIVVTMLFSIIGIFIFSYYMGRKDAWLEQMAQALADS